ncbi:Dyp-type peroxidase [Streptomyces chumphonensis]|uniref:Dyp-type peroxidase n=1 Tax=Streptomyces chumphonensis TaxID=1214925 RepID=UPI003D7305DD
MTMEAVRIDFDKETGIGPADREGAFDPAERRLMEDLQGNILKSHGRGHSRHLFVRFDSADSTGRDRGRAWLADMADRVTTAMKQWDDSRRRAALFAAAGFGPLGVSVGLRFADGPRLTLDAQAGPFGGSVGAGLGGALFGGTARSGSDRGGARPDSEDGHGGDGGGRLVDPEALLEAELARNPSDVFVNLMLSASGYRALGFTRLPADEAFVRGSRDAATLTKLCDPPVEQWHRGFRESLHALVIVADDDPERVQRAAEEIRADLLAARAGHVVHEEAGKVLRLRPNGPAREHFGFADGVSEPHFLAKDVERAKKEEGHSVWHPGGPLSLVLAKDPGGDAETGYGSYVVYRKLEQDVPHFDAQRLRLARALAEADGRAEPHEGDKELAGAYMVGRFRGGMPVNLPATAAGVDAPIPNDFDFSDDQDGLKCPYQAHTRKTNPRGDTVWRFGGTLEEERRRRIARRGISYESDGTVGLLFLCAQADIAEQFEFMQDRWCNDVDFIAGGADGKPSTGQDPVVGVGSAQTPTHWPRKHGVAGEKVTVSLSESVTLRGAEYFFVPSRSFLRGARG